MRGLGVLGFGGLGFRALGVWGLGFSTSNNNHKRIGNSLSHSICNGSEIEVRASVVAKGFHGDPVVIMLSS